jgi:hypothetical protein
MARASTYTTIALDRVADVLQLDPLHFNSVVSTEHPEMYACDDTWFQYDWQNVGKVSREALARALYTAERKVYQWLGYSLLPEWVTGESHALPVPYSVDLPNTVYNVRGGYKTITAKRGYIISGGVRVSTLVEAKVHVVYLDKDGDGYKETGSVSTATSVTDPEEIYLYFSDHNGEREWEIRPIEVSIVEGVANITFRRELGVMPELWEKTAQAANELLVDADDDDNFISGADVYRVYNDTSSQIYFRAPFSDMIVTGHLAVQDRDRGIFAYRTGTWDVDTEEWRIGSGGACNATPDRMEINYYAGITGYGKYPSKRMDPAWERDIIYYALSLIDAELCGCSNMVEHAQYMRRDLAESSGDSRFTLSFDQLRSPFGTTRAGINLWHRISEPGVRLFKQ